MASVRIGTHESNGVEVEVSFDPYNGNFSATAGGKYLTNEKYANLKAAIDRATKSARVEVEVHVIRVRRNQGWAPGDITVNTAVLTGLHGANGNVLATVQFRGEPQKIQITPETGVSWVGGDTTKEELAEYNSLLRLKDETQSRIREWETGHEIKPKTAVERAIAARTPEGE